MIGRALLLIAIVGTTLHHAGAQLGVPPAAAPAQCQELLALRDELRKHDEAIKAASERKADAGAACRLFRAYVTTQAKILEVLETHGASCGVPAHLTQRIRESHPKAQQIERQVCDAARQPLRYDPLPLEDDQLIPMPRPEPWPTRLSEHQ